MANCIERIKLELDGQTWNEVTLVEFKKGRRVETKYSNITKKTVMKLLNSSKCPTVSDFEGWVADDDAAEKKKNSKENCGVICSAGFSWYE